ncbi:MAG: ribosomal RNA small subunit methyltransferase A, partial [Thermotoga sp.]
KEVADRILARPGTRNFGYISALSKVVCDVEKLFDVSRSHFIPNPQVDSTVVLLRKKKDVEDFEALSFFLGKLFSKRRKTVRNNLKDLFEKAETILEKFGIDPMKRPENLSLEDIIKLFEEWYSWRRNSSKKY